MKPENFFHDLPSYLHAKKIVHRDVKPDNFLFLTKDPDSPLKMIDFGLAERYDKVRLTEAVGTPYYVAPEVLRMMDNGVRSREYTEKCDMWSIGVIGYQLFTKRRPFEGSVSDIFQQIMSRPLSAVFAQADWRQTSYEGKDLVGSRLEADEGTDLVRSVGILIPCPHFGKFRVISVVWIPLVSYG